MVSVSMPGERAGLLRERERGLIIGLGDLDPSSPLPLLSLLLKRSEKHFISASVGT